MRLIVVCLLFMIDMLGPSRSLAQVRSFPLNIVTLAADPKETIDKQRAEKFVSILNERFRERSGKVIFNFALKSFFRVNEMEVKECEKLLALGDQKEKPVKDDVYVAFDKCADSRLADHRAINVYIFRPLWEDETAGSSRIYFHNFEPFVFMNINRLDNIWSVWEHEFGHVFGLPEMPACGSTPESPTNIMGHVFEFCEGTGGNRSLGFEPWQTAIIKTTAAIVAKKLQLDHRYSEIRE